MRLAPAILLIAAGVFSLTGCSGPALLNTLADTPGGSDRIRDIAYGEDLRQRYDIYIPAGDGPFPVLVFVHGGGWSSGHKDDYAFAGQQFAGRGYLTAVPTYRLAPAHPWPAFAEDTAAAVAALSARAAEWGGDPDHLFLAGHSAGAYNAVIVAVADRFLAGEGVRPGIIDGVAGLSGPYDFRPPYGKMVRTAFGDAADTDDIDATTHVDRSDPPMLLIHGTADEVVEMRHSLTLAAALTEAGVRAELRLYEGDDHAAPLVHIARPGRGPTVEDMDLFFRSVMAE